MIKLLTADPSNVRDIVFDALDDSGFNEPTEAIPGLIEVIAELIGNAPDDAQEDLLTETIELLEDQFD